MAAEIDFMDGREPAQVPAAAVRPGEGGFREIVLVGDRLHRRLGQPVVQDEDGGRVAGEHLVGERVDLMHRQDGHGVSGRLRQASATRHL